MALKTNYKDDIYEGNRKYNQVSNSDGTISLVDQTNYTQEGDPFKAEDINATNMAINRLYDVRTGTLTAGGWTSSAPYMQTITVEGLKDTDRPDVSCKALLPQDLRRRIAPPVPPFRKVYGDHPVVSKPGMAAHILFGAQHKVRLRRQLRALVDCKQLSHKPLP